MEPALTCEEWEARLWAVLDSRGDLSQPELQHHLQACASCRQLYAISLKFSELPVDNFAVPSGLTDRILERVQQPVAPSADLLPQPPLLVPADRSPVPRGVSWWIVAGTVAAAWFCVVSPWHPATVNQLADRHRTRTISTGTDDLKQMVATAGNAYERMRQATSSAADDLALLVPGNTSRLWNVLPQRSATDSTGATPSTTEKWTQDLQPLQRSVQNAVDFFWNTLPDDPGAAG